MTAPNLNYLWAGLLVEELVRNNVGIFVIAPGSRSAPLAVSAFKNTNAEVVTHFDERGAAFFALGCGRMGRPAAVICTSGTAVVNCWPAVAEAYYSSVPLLIVSADRPPELHGCAANQTMEQERIFGTHVRAHLELHCPDTSVPPEAILGRINAALAAGIGDQPGPVHINCMFREPLAPTEVNEAWHASYLSKINHWQNGTAPFKRWEVAPKVIPPSQCEALANMLASIERGLLVLGGMQGSREQEAALKLANKLGWPVVADITSGCRRRDVCPNILSHHDILLRSVKFREYLTPDCVLHLGDIVVSKQLQKHLRSLDTPYIHLSPRTDNRDPLHRGGMRYVADITNVCHQLEQAIVSRPATAFLGKCISTEEMVRERSRRLIDGQPGLTELAAAQLVDDMLPSDMIVFLGNSMPIRDMDSIALNFRTTHVHANRGLSGIDGNIATAAGLKWSSRAGVVALIGDMTALHDINSLALLAKTPPPLILLIINNQGGGIFNFLPVAEHADVLNPCFVNSHPWKFDRVAAMFNLEYAHVSSKESFRGTLNQAIRKGTSLVLEIEVSSKQNIEVHKQYYSELVRHIEACFE